MSEFYINNPSNLISSTITTKILERSKSLDYHSSLPFYQQTPRVALSSLAKEYGVKQIYLKDESFRFGLNAFKGLGASYAIHKLIEKQPNIKTFCTATDGNHGRAVAWASRIANRKAVIFVPRDTARSRITAIENEGASVKMLDANYDETCKFAERTSKENGWCLLQDTAWKNYEEIPANIMAGYLTMFKEMEDDLHTTAQPNIDVVFLQVGVGSWAGAAVWYYLNRYGKNRPKIVVVEPSEANGMLASFKAGRRIEPHCSFQTIMAGLNCGIPSLSGWNIIRNGVDAALSVEDELAEKSMQKLYYPIDKDPKVVAGESGVGGLAGLIAIITKPEMRPLKEHLGLSSQSQIMLYSTEGATDPENFNRVVRI